MTVPLCLTLSRLIIAPVILPGFLWVSLPCENFWINKILAFLTASFALTDFLDGYLARRWQQTSSLGKKLDPLADKVFVLSLLFTLYLLKQLPFLFVMLILIRELWITILRYYYTIPVSIWGKSKSVLQYFLIVFTIGMPWINSNVDFFVKSILMLVAAFVTIASGSLYSKETKTKY